MNKMKVKELDELERLFSNVDDSEYPDIHQKGFRQLERGLWVLLVAKKELDIPYLNADQIAHILTEIKEISTTKKNVVRSFTRAGSKINNREIREGVTFYKIMKEGEDHLSKISGQDNLSVVLIESGKPRTAKKRFEEIARKLSGDLFICDPYYGIKTLDVLEKINPRCGIRFLTSRTNEKIDKFNSALKDFRVERTNFEIKIYPKHNELHDRYIISTNSLIIIGHGLKDLGNKESFIVVLPSEIASDLKESLIEVFNRRWKLSKPL